MGEQFDSFEAYVGAFELGSRDAATNWAMPFPNRAAMRAASGALRLDFVVLESYWRAPLEDAGSGARGGAAAAAAWAVGVCVCVCVLYT